MTNFALIADNGAFVEKNVDLESAALNIQGMTVSYGSEPAIYSVDFNVAKGTLTAIIGPNGAGKSTLLKAVMGIIPTVSGQVRFFGKPLSKMRHRISYVFPQCLAKLGFLENLLAKCAIEYHMFPNGPASTGTSQQPLKMWF